MYGPADPPPPPLYILQAAQAREEAEWQRKHTSQADSSEGAVSKQHSQKRR